MSEHWTTAARRLRLAALPRGLQGGSCRCPSCFPAILVSGQRITDQQLGPHRPLIWGHASRPAAARAPSDLDRERTLQSLGHQERGVLVTERRLSGVAARVPGEKGRTAATRGRWAASALATLVLWLSAPGAFAYNFAKPITIDRSKIPAGCGTTLANYPMLFSVTDADLRRTASGGKVTDPEGDDIIFNGLDATTCGGPSTCVLAHEIEKYVNTTGELVAWVRIPAVKTSAAGPRTPSSTCSTATAPSPPPPRTRPACGTPTSRASGT